MILILASERDTEVPQITRKLEALGAEYLWFDPKHFPASAELTISYNRHGSVRRLLHYKQNEKDLDQVRAVWNRARARPIADPKVTDEHQWRVAEECSRFLAELWECVDCLWLPHRPIADRDAERVRSEGDKRRFIGQPPRLPEPSAYNKLHQLAVAGQLGFRVPRTVVTNSPKRFLQFYEECQGPIVSKGPTEPLLLTYKGEKRMTYTYPVQRRNAAAYQAIRFSPVVFQEEIPKKLELRVTVVGAKVFPAAIMSQESRMLRHDWRHYPSFGGSRYYSVYMLPAKVEDLCVRMVESLGLCFGAIDMILTPEGEYVFLEVNPNGQWGWIEHYTGLPIGDAIVELLLRGAA